MHAVAVQAEEGARQPNPYPREEVRKGHMAEEALLVFTPSGKRGHFPKGTKILHAARELGVDVDSLCGGRGICGRCKVIPGFGAFSKHGVTALESHITDKNAVEERYESKRSLVNGRRLSCQAELQGDLVVDVPPESQIHKQIVRKSADTRTIEIDPIVRLCVVKVREPDMHEPSGDMQRVREALEQQFGIKDVTLDLSVLHTLQRALRKGGWTLTLALYNETEIIAVWPGVKASVYGLAIDLGSTTIAAHLCDLRDGSVQASTGIMNPQIRFGEDLMSRVSYAMLNAGGDKEMTRAVREALNDLVGAACEEAGIAREDVVDMTLVGNPVMHHLLLGIDPVELGGAPFALATDEAMLIKASELDIYAHAGARAYILPCIAGHVGADAAAVALSERPDLCSEVTFAVDVGTNAEMIFGNRDRLLAASSPTGPAFEGAQISSGQRAAAGAIERVRIDPATLEPRFRIIGSDKWSNEDGFAEAAAQNGITGICGSGIIEAIAEMYLAGLIDEDGVIKGEKASVSMRVFADDRTFSYLLHEGEPRITITQNDVRAIQMAKGALYAGAQLLSEHFGCDAERVVLAGAFGSHIDTKYAMVLGMIPDCDLEKVSSAGNAAGTGARVALLNAQARRDIEALVKKIEKIETAVEPKFQEHFVSAMAIPNKVNSYPKLRAQIAVPPFVGAGGSNAQDGSSSGRRRRRRS